MAQRWEGALAAVTVRPTWRDRMEPVREAGWLLVGLKIALGVLALYVIGSQSVPGPCNFELARDGWITIPPLADQGSEFLVAGVWQHWDSCWIGKIAIYGYEPGLNSVTFFPAMPLLTAAVTPLMRGSVAIAGEVVAARNNDSVNGAKRKNADGKTER